jgi:hypothetical protein
MTTARNDPCPCGSGRKYKKCHLAANEASRAAERPGNVSPLHEIDQALVEKMLAFAVRRFAGEVEGDRQFPGLEDSDGAMQFLAPWAVYGATVRGRTIVDEFLQSHAWSLTPGEREWLDAQQQSWYSFHEVLHVDRGRGLGLRDLLTLQERFVHEVKGTMNAQLHVIMLGRVVESRGTAVMAGLYPQPLPPLEGMRVVEIVRASLRKKGFVPPELLRRPETASMIVGMWDDAVQRIRTRAVPRLQNTDGDEVLLITERYSFDPSRRADLEAALAAAKLVRENDDTFILLRKKDRTVLGSVTFGGGELRIDTNSSARSDRLCEIVEVACGALLTEGLASITDPRAVMTGREPSEPIRIAVDLKRRYYHEQWMKDHIPALDGKTPRQAARSRRGRELLETLLKQLDYAESLLPEKDRFDVSELRDRLGLTREPAV